MTTPRRPSSTTTLPNSPTIRTTLSLREVNHSTHSWPASTMTRSFRASSKLTMLTSMEANREERRESSGTLRRGSGNVCTASVIIQSGKTVSVRVQNTQRTDVRTQIQRRKKKLTRETPSGRERKQMKPLSPPQLQAPAPTSPTSTATTWPASWTRPPLHPPCPSLLSPSSASSSRRRNRDRWKSFTLSWRRTSSRPRASLTVFVLPTGETRLCYRTLIV